MHFQFSNNTHFWVTKDLDLFHKKYHAPISVLPAANEISPAEIP